MMACAVRGNPSGGRVIPATLSIFVQIGGAPGSACRERTARIAADKAGEGWEAGQRPDPGSLGLLPSGPDPVGEWLVHRQPPAAYIVQMGGGCKRWDDAART